MDNAVRQKLRVLMESYGRSLCDDVGRCRGLLYDAYPKGKLEIHVLVNALEHRVPQDLLSRSGRLPVGALCRQLTQRLIDNVALTAVAAQWAVESWMLALDLVSEADLAKSFPPADSAQSLLAGPPAPQSGSSRLAPLLVVFVLLIISIGVGAWYVYDKKQATTDEDSSVPMTKGEILKNPETENAPTKPTSRVNSKNESKTLLQRVFGYLGLEENAPHSPENEHDQALAKRMYNALMADIEPDLVFESIAKLDAKYAGETAEQHASRLLRYEAAFQKVEIELRKVKARFHRENLEKLKEFLQVEEWSQLKPTTIVEGLKLGKWVDEVRSEKKKNGLKDHPWLVAELQKISGWQW